MYFYVTYTKKLTISVTESVRRNFKDANNKEVEVAIKDWLRNAKDREGGRNQRREVNVNL